MNNYFNAHTHSFSADCAPKDFLKVGLNIGDMTASSLEWLIRTGAGQWLLRGKLGNTLLGRRAEFLKIGTMSTQFEVFSKNLKDYDRSSSFTGIKFVVLTMDMNYMADSQYTPTRDFEAQLWDIVNKVKPTYPDRVFPFLGIDPRNPRNIDFDNRIQKPIANKTFAGIKLYPSHGFFPFDPRLEPVYKYASDNNIPLMTHCTRTGSFYIGSNVWSLIPEVIPSLNPNHPAMKNIYSRITLYRNTRDRAFLSNERICNLFLHPDNYLPVLDKYPKLKLCFAHLGGVMEILGSSNGDSKTATQFKSIYKFENANRTWYEMIRDILNKYPNTYSDISYTLYSKDAMTFINNELTANSLPEDRILFGTDYFMVEQETNELSAVSIAQSCLPKYFIKMISDNPKTYLSL